MPVTHGVFTVQSNKIVQQNEFDWKWAIENYELKQTYTRKFSLMDGRLVMRVELKPSRNAKFMESEPVWYFETIPKAWNKEFHLSVFSKKDGKFFCDTLAFQKILLNRQYASQESVKLNRVNLKYVLINKKTLDLSFEMTIRDVQGSLPTQNDTFGFDESIHSNGLKNALADDKFSDFEFIVDGVKVPAHKALLASRSEVFNEIFDAKDEEKEKEIANIEGASKSSLENFLKYLYTDELEVNDNIADYLYLANKFNVPGVKEKCEELLSQQLKDSTSIDTYKYVFRYNLSQELKVNSFKFIQKKFLKLNHNMDDSFIDNVDLVTALLNSYQFLLDGLNKRVKFAAADEKITT